MILLLSVVANAYTAECQIANRKDFISVNNGILTWRYNTTPSKAVTLEYKFNGKSNYHGETFYNYVGADPVYDGSVSIGTFKSNGSFSFWAGDGEDSISGTCYKQ